MILVEKIFNSNNETSPCRKNLGVSTLINFTGGNTNEQKIQTKLILQLDAAGSTQNMIAKSHHISKTSLGEVFRLAEKKGISHSDVEDKRPKEVYRLLFPEKCEAVLLLAVPNYKYTHSELSRTGITLTSLERISG